MKKPGIRALILASAVAALAVQGLIQGVVPAFATTTDESCFISAINSARGSAGLPGLGINLALQSIAEGWSQSMAAVDVLSHNMNLPNVAPSDWMHLGENVGEGPTCDAIATAFMNSPEHKANILDTNYTTVGVGVVVDGNGVMWVTEDFMGTGAATPAAPAPAPAASTPAPAPATVPAPVAVHTTVPAPAPVDTVAAPVAVHTTVPPASSSPAPSPSLAPAAAPSPAASASPAAAATPTPAVPIVATVAHPAAPPRPTPHTGLLHEVLSNIGALFSQIF
jgi:hypothetical protein